MNKDISEVNENKEEKQAEASLHPEPVNQSVPEAEQKALRKKKGAERREYEKRARGSLSAYMNWPIWVSIGLLVLCAAITAVDWVAGGIASVICIVIVLILVGLTLYYYRRVSSDMVTFGAGYAQIQKQLLQEMNVPYAVTDEKGYLIWMNSAFKEIAKTEIRGHRNLTSLFPDIHRKYPKNGEPMVIHSSYQDRKYQVTIKGVALQDIVTSVLDTGEHESLSPQMYAVYLYDETEMLACKQQIEDEKRVTARIYLDNYDEALDSIEEVRKTLLIALIDRQINKYINSYQGVIQRLENDKYFAIFTYKHLLEMQENHFSLIEDVKKVNIGNTTAVTISMGLGVNGGSYTKDYEYARAAIDMALGRGGDQVVLKNKDNITYYGGKAENQGKNTRVKARVKAQALRELIESADDVLIMGHHISDADCIGAAAGIYRAAVFSRKRAHIVLDTVSNNIKPLIERFKNNPDYEPDLFINNSAAFGKIHHGTLLVVVDNNRASYSECPGLVNLARNVVVIDHHRQTKDYIENTVLSYVEPYASSASEMVSEILQYYDEDIRLKPTDSEALYAGIVVDTNNFMNKTGVRTFEAAAFLRRNGADVTRVRKLFRDDMSDYKAKAEVVRSMEVFMGCYAISVCPAAMTQSPTVIAAQAANELLGIQNIKASFVLTDYDHQIYISARSIDELNVQVIMEKLGGGGHLSVAGAQLKDTTVEQAKTLLKEVLKQQKDIVPAK